jgi:outer membrane protein TolC
MLVTGSLANGAAATERSVSLDEAIRLALENNERIFIQRESLVAAGAAVSGAEGSYDPLLGAEVGWRDGATPVNSSFSGAREGALAPSEESAAAAVTLDQLLPTGGRLSVIAAADRSESDGLFDLLSPSYGTRAGIELRQPLLRNRAIDEPRFRVRAAEADRAGASAALAAELADTVAAVEQAYWSLVAAHREVQVREQAVQLAEEQLAETQIRIETGTAPELEIAQPRAELERRRGELFASREIETRAGNTLKRLVLRDDDPTLWSDRIVPESGADPTLVPIDLAAAMERALATRPELAISEAALERRRLESALRGDAVRPALDAVISYDRYGLAGERNRSGEGGAVPPALEGGLDDSFDLLRDGDLDDKRVALVLSIPLGNREARAGAAIAKSAERQAEAEHSRLRKAIRTEVLDAAAGLETAGQRIEAARAAREAAKVQLDSEGERYGAGMSTNFLVLTRQNDLSRAWLDEIAAQTDYRRAETELARVSGGLLAARGIEIEPATSDLANEGMQTEKGEVR